MKLKSFIFGAIAVLAFVSCDRNTDGLVLDAPVLEISDTSSTSFTVAWNAVEGADMYTYEFMEDQASTEKLSVSFEDLKTDTLYTVKVKAVSTVAKAESEWSEISVELVSSGTSPDPEYVINLTAEMKPDMVLNVKTSPTDKEAPYYFEPVPGSIYEGFNDDPEAMFMDIINTYLAYYQYDSAMAFEELKMTGDEDKDYNISKYAEPEFFVFAAGIDEEMNITTAVESVKVSLDLPVSENEFVIVVDVCTQSEIRVTVAPTNGDQYALILQDKETVDALSDTQLKSLLLSLVNDNNLCVNETTMTYNKNIVPSHDYSILVFGYEEGVITTAINRKDIRTPDPVVVEDLTFEFEITPVGPREVDVEIRPSDEAASYFYDVVSLSDWAQYYQNEPSLYVEEMADSQGRDVLDYLDASRFFPDKSHYEHIRLYSVFGGSPYVLSLLDESKTLEENIEGTIITLHGSIRSYIEAVINMEVGRIPHGITILSLIGNGKKRYAELEDAVHHPVPGEAPWKGDSIQFAFDGGGKGLAGDRIEFVLTLDREGRAGVVKNFAAPLGGDLPERYTPANEPMRTAAVAGERRNGRTVYRLRLPVSELYPLTVPPNGTLRFSLLANNNDGSGRAYYREWASGIGGEKSPAEYGDLTVLQPVRELLKGRPFRPFRQGADQRLAATANGYRVDAGAIGRKDAAGVAVSVGNLLPNASYRLTFRARGTARLEVVSFAGAQRIDLVKRTSLKPEWQTFEAVLTLPEGRNAASLNFFAWEQPGVFFEVSDISLTPY